MAVIGVIIIGFQSHFISSLSEECIRAERSIGAFELFNTEIIIPYYYQDAYGKYTLECYNQTGCLLLSEARTLVLTTSFLADYHGKRFLLGQGKFQCLNDSLNFDKPVVYNCIFSQSFCFCEQHYSLILWDINKCLQLPLIGSINAEIWTVHKKPLIKFISIQIGPNSYLLQLRDYLTSNKICLNDIIKTNIDKLVIRAVSKLTQYKIDLTQFNLSETSNVFCRNVTLNTDNSNSNTDVIVFFIILVVFLIIIILSTSLAYLKSSRRISEISEKLMMNSQQLNVILQKQRGTVYSHSCQQNEKMLENSLYSES